MWGEKEECQLSLKLLIKNTTAKTDTGFKSFKDYVIRPSNNSQVCYTTDIKYTFPEIIFLAMMVYITNRRGKDLCRAEKMLAEHKLFCVSLNKTFCCM